LLPLGVLCTPLYYGEYLTLTTPAVAVREPYRASTGLARR
jgi:hypothetical protein